MVASAVSNLPGQRSIRAKTRVDGSNHSWDYLLVQQPRPAMYGHVRYHHGSFDFLSSLAQWAHYGELFLMARGRQ